MLDVRLHVGGAPDPQQDRPMPEGCWRPCPCCVDGEAVRYRTVLELPGGRRVTEAAGVGVCGACSGGGYVRL